MKGNKHCTWSEEPSITVKQGDGSVIVWGAIAAALFPLAFIDDNIGYWG